jgi:hypothetical protein
MTTAPQHPPVHGYSGEDPYELIPSPYGVMERWRAAAMSTGEVSGLSALSDWVKNDTVAKLDGIEERERAVSAREDAISARERVHAVNVANFVDFVGKASALFDRLDKLHADQEREAEDPLTLPPGAPSEVSKEPELAPEDDTHIPGGELHDIPAKALETSDQTEFPDPELPRPPVQQQPISAGLDAEEFEEEKHGD